MGTKQMSESTTKWTCHNYLTVGLMMIMMVLMMKRSMMITLELMTMDVGDIIPVAFLENILRHFARNWCKTFCCQVRNWHAHATRPRGISTPFAPISTPYNGFSAVRHFDFARQCRGAGHRGQVESRLWKQNAFDICASFPVQSSRVAVLCSMN